MAGAPGEVGCHRPGDVLMLQRQGIGGGMGMDAAMEAATGLGAVFGSVGGGRMAGGMVVLGSGPMAGGVVVALARVFGIARLSL